MLEKSNFWGLEMKENVQNKILKIERKERCIEVEKTSKYIVSCIKIIIR